jgi:hypothetical protein
MKHFDITEWTDFARGLGAASQRAAQARHLADGCRRCTQLHNMLHGVVTAAQTQLDAPSADLVERAAGIFAMPSPKRTSKASLLLAHLAFDSFDAPLAMGVRSGGSLSRHALFKAGAFDIDVRLEYDHASLRVGLVGQVANSEDPLRPVAHVPITVSSGNAIVARATTNDFGEFQLDYERQPELCLRVPLDTRGPTLEVPLGSLDESLDTGRHGRRPVAMKTQRVKRGNRSRL